MRHPLLPLCAALLLGWSLACASFDATPMPPGEAVAAATTRLDDLLEPIRVKHDLPALGAAVFDSSGRLLGVGAVGRRAVGLDDIPTETVTVQDRWHLGSDTKAMTATLAGLVVEQSDLSFDTPVTELMPQANPAWKAVTLGHLLSHTGGVVDEASIWSRESARFGYGFEDAAAGRAAWAEGFVTEPPAGELGSYQYSNQGYVLAGHLLERQKARSWEQMMREDLFGPLKMTAAGFGPPAGPHPWGHSEMLDSNTAIQPTLLADNPGVLGPAGVVHATLSDWARFGVLHLAAARGKPRLLTAETFATLHAPVTDHYAMGWIVANDDDFGGASVLAHDGSNTFWYARILLVPDQDRGFLIVTNTARNGTAAADDALAALAAAGLE